MSNRRTFAHYGLRITRLPAVDPMSFATGPFRLAHLPRAARVAVSLFVIVLGSGYLSALVNLYATYSDADGKAGLTPDDVKLRLYGNRSSTTLESVIVPGGKMSQYMQEPGGREAMIAWLHAGASQAGFLKVQPILNRNCVRCHNPSGAASFRPLTNFQQVSAVAQVDTGESWANWARTAHTHIQSMALMYLALGLAFAFCGVPDRIKIPVISIPFVAIITDFTARALAHYWPAWTYVVLLSGMFIAIATGVLSLGILYELWVVRRET